MKPLHAIRPAIPDIMMKVAARLFSDYRDMRFRVEGPNLRYLHLGTWNQIRNDEDMRYWLDSFNRMSAVNQAQALERVIDRFDP